MQTQARIPEAAQFRACAGAAQGFGATPAEALNALMIYLASDAPTPIVIWPYNRGDAFFSHEQQRRLQELKARGEAQTPEEKTELEGLIEESFEATVARTQTIQSVKA